MVNIFVYMQVCLFDCLFVAIKCVRGWVYNPLILNHLILRLQARGVCLSDSFSSKPLIYVVSTIYGFFSPENWALVVVFFPF